MRRKLYKLIAPTQRLYWFLFRPKTYGVKCVVMCGDEILMIKNSYGGWKKWMFPGGGIDKGESEEFAAKRELEEEVGVKGRGFRKIGVYTSEKEYKRDTVTVFACETQDKRIAIDPDEIARAKWFHLKDLPSDISDYSRNILLMLPMMNKRQNVV